MKDKEQKILLISILVIVILIICIILLLRHFENNEKEEATPPNKMPIISELEEETNYTEYFTVQNIINKVFEFSTTINEMEYNASDDNQTNHVQEYMEEYLESAFYYYLDNNEISKDEFKQIYKQYINETYTIESMYVYNKTEDIKLIYIDGILQKSGLNYPIVFLHNEINYTILPYEYLQQICGKNNIINNLDNIKIENIEDKVNNKFRYISITEQKMAIKYFNHYKKLMLENTDEAYKLLNTEYKSKRFSNIENFKNYIKENYKTIANTAIKQYKVEYYDDYTRYICIDKERKLLYF